LDELSDSFERHVFLEDNAYGLRFFVHVQPPCSRSPGESTSRVASGSSPTYVCS
jgi:hypothetical protein